MWLGFLGPVCKYLIVLGSSSKTEAAIIPSCYVSV